MKNAILITWCDGQIPSGFNGIHTDARGYNPQDLAEIVKEQCKAMYGIVATGGMMHDLPSHITGEEPEPVPKENEEGEWLDAPRVTEVYRDTVENGDFSKPEPLY